MNTPLLIVVLVLIAGLLLLLAFVHAVELSYREQSCTDLHVLMPNESCSRCGYTEHEEA